MMIFFSGKTSRGMMAHFEAGITPVKKRYMIGTGRGCRGGRTIFSFTDITLEMF
jgi:hypothetical protein